MASPVVVEDEPSKLLCTNQLCTHKSAMDGSASIDNTTPSVSS